MKKTLLYTHHHKYDSFTRELVAGKDGVDDFYTHRDGWIEIRYKNGNNDLIPLSQVLRLSREGGF